MTASAISAAIDDGEAGNRQGRRHEWAIPRLRTRRFGIAQLGDAIGTITLSFGATDANTAALGFVLARAHWGQGLGSESIRIEFR
ncbi:GNAT family N-acetyltransferase [Aminobacter aminovorans]|uniref:RimJ/RimL family protein N-acetyltransferase n=1 Tax=Aminobacter aminovorans TaxID=83263 RepID=A0ABR6H6C4_AMIAI|nr:GNAT family N-acetyltransferase [Aminobacter aminovorans]MBB3706042.1 RimJ/RimL family protein N-acetyltransferase [Aminobacter aminovorans]